MEAAVVVAAAGKRTSPSAGGEEEHGVRGGVVVVVVVRRRRPRPRCVPRSSPPLPGGVHLPNVRTGGFVVVVLVLLVAQLLPRGPRLGRVQDRARRVRIGGGNVAPAEDDRMGGVVVAPSSRRAANYGAVVIFARRAVDPPSNRDGDGDGDGNV